MTRLDSLRNLVAAFLIMLIHALPELVGLLTTLATFPFFNGLGLGWWEWIPAGVAVYCLASLMGEQVLTVPRLSCWLCLVSDRIADWAGWAYDEIDINTDPNMDPYEGEVTR